MISPKWPDGSIIDNQVLTDQIAKFLRTHRKGHQQLFQFMDSVPANRTEDEYNAGVERHKAESEASYKALLESQSAPALRAMILELRENLNTVIDRTRQKAEELLR